jgi:hypothetical protein
LHITGGVSFTSKYHVLIYELLGALSLITKLRRRSRFAQTNISEGTQQQLGFLKVHRGHRFGICGTNPIRNGGKLLSGSGLTCRP